MHAPFELDKFFESLLDSLDLRSNDSFVTLIVTQGLLFTNRSYLVISCDLVGCDLLAFFLLLVSFGSAFCHFLAKTWNTLQEHETIVWHCRLLGGALGPGVQQVRCCDRSGRRLGGAERAKESLVKS
jgi:hypothetical protein